MTFPALLRVSSFSVSPRTRTIFDYRCPMNHKINSTDRAVQRHSQNMVFHNLKQVIRNLTAAMTVLFFLNNNSMWKYRVGSHTPCGNGLTWNTWALTGDMCTWPWRHDSEKQYFALGFKYPDTGCPSSRNKKELHYCLSSPSRLYLPQPAENPDLKTNLLECEMKIFLSSLKDLSSVLLWKFSM